MSTNDFVDILISLFLPKVSGRETKPKETSGSKLSLRKDPIQHVLNVLVLGGHGCCSCPGFYLRLGASDCSPGLAFCFMGPWTLAWICCPQLPYHPCKNRTHSTCFYSTGGHTPNFSFRNMCVCVCVCVFSSQFSYSSRVYFQSSFSPFSVHFLDPFLVKSSFDPILVHSGSSFFSQVLVPVNFPEVPSSAM